MEALPEIVTTPRLTLRVWRAQDAPAFGRAVRASIEHLRPWLAWAGLEPIDDTEREATIRRWSDEWRHGGDAIYGAFLEDTVVGGCGLHRRVGPDGLEIGYWINADHVRQGYATELACGLTGAALDHRGIERVEIHHDKANRPSGLVARALGYRFVDETPDEIVAPGEVGLSRRWVMTGAEWAARRPSGSDRTSPPLSAAAEPRTQLSRPVSIRSRKLDGGIEQSGAARME